MFKDLLQGKWLKHPLHPIVVSLPLGLWPISLLLDVVSLYGRGCEAAVTASFYALVFGMLGAGAAVITGLADFTEIKPDKPAKKIAYKHLALNVLGTLFWLGSLLLHLPARDGGVVHAPSLAVVCSAIGLIISLVAAYLGGRMVYDQGVGIGRFSKHELKEIARSAGNNVPREKEQGA